MFSIVFSDPVAFFCRASLDANIWLSFFLSFFCQSVPPLFESLKRIWGWIDADLSEQELWPWEQASPIARRYAWWEDLVARIDRTEDEVLCLA